MGNTIIERVFIYRIISFVIVVGIMIAILLFIRWSLKGDVRLKWIFSGCIFISVIVTTVLGISLSKIYLDIKNEDYVTYCGQYVERGGGQQELKTLVVYDESGKEIRLLRTGPSEKGLYKGTVVYGRRSRIVVEYDGISIE